MVGVVTAGVEGIGASTVVVSAAGKALDPVAPCDFGRTEHDANRSNPRVEAIIETWRTHRNSCPPHVVRMRGARCRLVTRSNTSGTQATKERAHRLARPA